MVVIRLSRGGSNKSPFYHIVAADRRFARDGRYLERLGRFNPIARGQEKRLEIVSERVNHWVKMGAQPSPRVKFLLAEFAKLGASEPVAAPRKSELKKLQQEAAEKAAFAAKQKAAAEEKAAAKAEAAADAEKPAE